MRIFLHTLNHYSENKLYFLIVIATVVLSRRILYRNPRTHSDPHCIVMRIRNKILDWIWICLKRLNEGKSETLSGGSEWMCEKTSCRAELHSTEGNRVYREPFTVLTLQWQLCILNISSLPTIY